MITRCWYESSMGIDSKNMVQSPRYAASDVYKRQELSTAFSKGRSPGEVSQVGSAVMLSVISEGLSLIHI